MRDAWEQVGASLALDEMGDRFVTPLLQHHVCVHGLINHVVVQFIYSI